MNTCFDCGKELVGCTSDSLGSLPLCWECSLERDQRDFDAEEAHSKATREAIAEQNQQEPEFPEHGPDDLPF